MLAGCTIVKSWPKVDVGSVVLASSLAKVEAGGWVCQSSQCGERSRLGCRRGGCPIRGPVPAQVYVATWTVASAEVGARRYTR